MTIITTLDSIESYKMYGVSCNLMSKALRTWPFIPEPYTPMLSQYQLLYWSPVYFLDQAESGVITRGGVAYNIVYGGDLTRGKILALSKEKTSIQLALSFRSALSIYNLPAYVLVGV